MIRTLRATEMRRQRIPVLAPTAFVQVEAQRDWLLCSGCGRWRSSGELTVTTIQPTFTATAGNAVSVGKP